MLNKIKTQNPLNCAFARAYLFSNLRKRTVRRCVLSEQKKNQTCDPKTDFEINHIIANHNYVGNRKNRSQITRKRRKTSRELLNSPQTPPNWYLAHNLCSIFDTDKRLTNGPSVPWRKQEAGRRTDKTYSIHNRSEKSLRQKKNVCTHELPGDALNYQGWHVCWLPL